MIKKRLLAANLILALAALHQSSFAQQNGSPDPYYSNLRHHPSGTDFLSPYSGDNPLLIRGQDLNRMRPDSLKQSYYGCSPANWQDSVREPVAIEPPQFAADIDANVGCKGCAGGCKYCCPNTCCVPCLRIYGEFLFLRAGNQEVVYGVPINGPVAPGVIPIQVGPLGTVDPDNDPGFRVGFTKSICQATSLAATYTSFASQTHSSMNASAPIVIRSMVIHPSSLNATADWLSARARYDVAFRLANLDYRQILLAGRCWSVTGLAGARYGQLEQVFRSSFSNIGTETINADVNFDGGGLRLGVEAERHAASCGIFLYGKTHANFVAGKFRGHYFQGNTFDPVIVDTYWNADRIVSMLDLELGLGWRNTEDCLRISAGYTISAWYNTVTTADFISAVQRNEFGGLSDVTTFDGLAARVELRF